MSRRQQETHESSMKYAPWQLEILCAPRSGRFPSLVILTRSLQ